MPPASRTSPGIASSTDASELMSSSTARMGSPRSSASWRSASSRSIDLLVAMTLYPSSASSRAVASPIPEEAPVIITVSRSRAI